MSIDAGLLAILACPNCRGPLREDAAAAELVCTGDCGYAYPVRDGIPVLLVDDARRPGDAATDGGTTAAPAAGGADDGTGPDDSPSA